MSTDAGEDQSSLGVGLHDAALHQHTACVDARVTAAMRPLYHRNQFALVQSGGRPRLRTILNLADGAAMSIVLKCKPMIEVADHL